jgi:hypothetical protein
MRASTIAVRFPWLALVLLVGLACTRNESPRSGARDGGVLSDASFTTVPGCDVSRDADTDQIADAAEGNSDTDGDGLLDRDDLDSDGDGTSDTEENAGAPRCGFIDSDGDGAGDFRDADSDNDGLSDADERGRYATDPRVRDTDGDGVTDLAEVAAGTDARDPASTIPPEDFFVVLPYLGAREPRTLRFGTRIAKADVYFLIDTTGSMEPPLANVRASLSRLAADLRASIPDLAMGVGQFRDFPFRAGTPFGTTFYGAPTDEPYTNVQDVTPELAPVQSALDGLTLGDGGDGPESAVEALFQTATGAGGAWGFAPTGATYTLPLRACPAIPDEFEPRRGYPCFRPGALPIVVLVTDLEWHNGSEDGTRWRYESIAPAPARLPEAAEALRGIGGRYVGVVIDDMFRSDHESVARMTGSVDATGAPLVYGAAAGEVSDRIRDGIETLALRTPQDVTLVSENRAPNPDDVDARLFIKSLAAVEGYGPGAGMGYASRADATFFGVTPGTLVDFAVEFSNDVVPPPPVARVYRARLVVIGNGSARLDEREVYIVVPPEGGTVLI